MPPQLPDEFNALALPRRSDAPAVQFGDNEIKLSEHSFQQQPELGTSVKKRFSLMQSVRSIFSKSKAGSIKSELDQ